MEGFNCILGAGQNSLADLFLSLFGGGWGGIIGLVKKGERSVEGVVRDC